MVRSVPVEAADPLESPGYGTGWLLRVAHRIGNKVFTEQLAELSIEPRHFGVLAHLARRQPLSQRQLIDLIGADKSAMVRSVDELEQRGLVVRRPDPQDRRAHAIVLTDTGHLVHRQAEQAAARASAQVFGHLSAAEHLDLHNLLRKVIDHR